MNGIGTIDVSWPAFLEQFSSPSHKIAYLGALPQAPSAPTAQSVHSCVRKVLGLIGLGCAVVGLVLLFGWREPERG